MHSRVALGALCAALGGAATAGGLLLSGAAATPATRSVVQAGPLLASGAIGGTAAGQVYQQDASGVVALRARTVSTPPTAFDDGRHRRYETGAAAVVGDGLLLTAAHLVRASSTVEIDAGGRTAQAAVVALDQANDLAVLKVDPSGLGVAPLALGDSDMVRVGDPAVALGRSPGAAPALSAGTIAARQPVLRSDDGEALADALQVDADLGPADVGGPLVDAGGALIGITTRMKTAGSPHPVDVAVPSGAVRRVLAHLSDPALKVVGG